MCAVLERASERHSTAPLCRMKRRRHRPRLRRTGLADSNGRSGTGQLDRLIFLRFVAGNGLGRGGATPE